MIWPKLNTHLLSHVQYTLLVNDFWRPTTVRCAMEFWVPPSESARAIYLLLSDWKVMTTAEMNSTFVNKCKNDAKFNTIRTKQVLKVPKEEKTWIILESYLGPMRKVSMYHVKDYVVGHTVQIHTNDLKSWCTLYSIAEWYCWVYI